MGDYRVTGLTQNNSDLEIIRMEHRRGAQSSAHRAVKMSHGSDCLGLGGMVN